MKNTTPTFIIIFIFIFACNSNIKKTEDVQDFGKKSNMHIEQNERIYVDAIINGDSIRLFFDTGTHVGFIGTENLINKYAYDSIPPEQDLGDKEVEALYKIPPIVIDSSEITYSRVVKLNMSGHGDGAFAPNYNEDKRIWELNFENGYVKIHDKDTVPPNAKIIPFRFCKYNHAIVAIVVKIPLIFISGNDSIYTDNEYLLDIGGAIPPITVLERIDNIFEFSEHTKHIDRIDEKSLMLRKKGVSRLIRTFEVDKIIIPDFRTIDSKSICFIDETPRELSHISICPKETKGLIGTGLFKYFNVFIDLKHQQIMLVNHNEKFSKYTNKTLGFGINLEKNTIRSITVNSQVDKAGLKVGDKIISINGINNINPIVFDSLINLPIGTPIILEVERDKKKITIHSETYEEWL